VNQVARDLLFRLRKKDYDFSAADTACNASFSILRRREGEGDEKNVKNGAKESKSAKMDDINGDEGCDDFDGKTGCVVSDSVGVSSVEEPLSVVTANSEARLDPEVGCDDVETEPAPKKAKLEDSSEKPLGPVSDADLIPLKPKVIDREKNLFLPLFQVGVHLQTDPDPALSKSLIFRHILRIEAWKNIFSCEKKLSNVKASNDIYSIFRKFKCNFNIWRIRTRIPKIWIEQCKYIGRVRYGFTDAYGFGFRIRNPYLLRTL
jgi:hypothetical protein